MRGRRRIVVVLVAMAMGLSTAACGGDDEPATTAGGQDLPATEGDGDAGATTTSAATAPPSTAPPPPTPDALAPATTVTATAGPDAFSFRPLLFGDQALVPVALGASGGRVSDGVGVAAVGIDGTIRWTVPACDSEGTWIERRRVVAGPIVVLDCGGEVVALSSADGAERWRHPAPDRGVRAASDDAAVVLATPDGVEVLDAATGDVRAEVPAGTTDPDVAVAGGQAVLALGDRVVAVGTADGSERWTADVEAVQVVTDGQVVVAMGPDLRLRGLDPATGALWWEQAEADPRLASATLWGMAGGRAVVQDGLELVVAFDGSTGEPVWSFNDEAEDIVEVSVGERFVVLSRPGSERSTSVLHPTTGAVLRVDPAIADRASVDGDRYAWSTSGQTVFVSLQPA